MLTIREHHLAQGIHQLVALYQIGAVLLHGLQKLGLHRDRHVHGLLTGAGHTVVVGTVIDGQHRHTVQVIIVIADDLLAVTLTHTEARTAAGIHSLYHTGASRGDVHVALAEHFIRGLNAAVLGINHLDQIGGGAQSLDLLANHVDGLQGDVLCGGVRGDDAGIPALDGHHAVGRDGHDRVGTGHDATHNAHGLGHNLDAGLVPQIFDVTYRLLAPHDVPLGSSASSSRAS